MMKVPGNLCRMIQRQIKHSGSIVCSEDSTAVGKGASGTFARQPLCIAARCSEIFVTRKMEFKGWVTDCTGVTMDEVAAFLVDLSSVKRAKTCGLGNRQQPNKGVD